jgi:hypothetical protein
LLDWNWHKKNRRFRLELLEYPFSTLTGHDLIRESVMAERPETYERVGRAQARRVQERPDEAPTFRPMSNEDTLKLSQEAAKNLMKAAELRGKERQKAEEERAQKMKKVQDRREVLNELPDSPAKTKMLEANQSAWERLTQGVTDWMDDKLFIQETFDEIAQMGLEGGNMGLDDRARHMLWMSKLGAEYGPIVAGAIGTAKEVENLFSDPWKQLRFMGKEDTDTIRERQFDALKEVGRDFQTNLFALRNQPYEDGERRAFTQDELRDIVSGLEVTESPLVGRPIAEAPTGLLPDTREVTTTVYPEPPAAHTAIGGNEPVDEIALPDWELSPGDIGTLGPVSLPVGAPDPKGGSGLSEIKQEDARGVMYRKDI